jgi:hypothetical protein
MEEDRHFTLDEANAQLEGLRAALTRIRDARRIVVRSAVPVKDGASLNGGGREGSDTYQALGVLRREVEALSARGIILRDAESGLIDFPSLREGRTVYLCWTPEEDRVGYWHEVDAGFGGRRPL